MHRSPALAWRADSHSPLVLLSLSFEMDQPLPSGRDSASEPVLRSRLLPRISFQSLLVATTIAAVLIAVVYAADQGGTYASAAAAGMFFAVTMLIGSALVFLLAWAVSFLPRPVGVSMIAVGVVLTLLRLVGVRVGAADFLQQPIWLLNFQIIGWFLLLAPIGTPSRSEQESPFAEGQLPPQILAPREPLN